MTFSYYDVDDDSWGKAAVSEGRRTAWLLDCTSVSRERDESTSVDDLRSRFLSQAEYALESFMRYHGHTDVEISIGKGMLNEAYTRSKLHALDKEDDVINRYILHVKDDGEDENIEEQALQPDNQP